jgi:hypothetical protein
MDREQLHRAANEMVLRQVNEAIERGQWPGEDTEPSAFRCECASLDCNRLLEITHNAYEAVRADPRSFVVAPGHEQPDVETVIETHPAYVVVEKRDEPGRLAQATDPRS